MTLATAFTLPVLLSTACFAQSVSIRKASESDIPTRVDGNSPSFWQGGQFHYITSTGVPVIVSGPNLFALGASLPITVDRMEHAPMWIESVWLDDDGVLYGWYHHEPGGLCVGNTLTAPEIGAVVSRDGGNSFEDLGIVLKSGDPLDCSAKNGFFAGGHGDFSVILNREKTYFYFLFTNYGGDVESQGVAMARLAFEDRAHPVGAVSKYWTGSWAEPGLGGKITPVFPARVSWQREDTDSLWGPAIHWNTFLERYIVLLNHACCKTNWPQDGIYAAFPGNLDQPGSWAPPYVILRNIGFGPGYYPQAIGLEAGETDTVAGQKARLFIQGKSAWELEFSLEPPGGGSTDPDDPGQPVQVKASVGRTRH